MKKFRESREQQESSRNHMKTKKSVIFVKNDLEINM